MSTSSIAAAKRRRAGNIVASPLFKSNANNNDSVQRRVNRSTETLQNETIQQLNTTNPSSTTVQPETTDFKKPMSLQQVITVFDKRLLVLEKAVIENKAPIESQNISVNNELNIVQNQKMVEMVEMVETLREDLKITLTEQSKEFDYRTTILANEITELKDIVIKLQSYTLEINKTLVEERQHFFSETEPSIQIQSDELLNDEDLEIIDNDENIAIELQEEVDEEVVEEAAQEEVVEEAAQEEVVEEAEQEEVAQEELIEEGSEEPVKEKKTRQKKKEKKTCSIDL